MSLVFAAFLLASGATTAPPDDKPFFTCPPRATLEVSQEQGSEQLKGVRCVTRRTGGAPVCPLRMVVTVAAGPDTCQPPRSTGAVTDGTSNTIAITEAPPPSTTASGTTTTRGSINVSAGPPPQPACPVVGDTLTVDAARSIDLCMRLEVRPPSVPLYPLSRMSSGSGQIID